MENVRATSDDGGVVLYTPDRITLGAGSTTLRDVVRSLNNAGFTKITLDLSDTSYMDSSGIGELVSAFTVTANNGGSLGLNRLPKRIKDLLQITKLYTVFDVGERNFDHLPTIEIVGADVSPIRAARALPIFLTLRDRRIQVELGVEDGLYKVQADETSGPSTLFVAESHAIASGKRTALENTIGQFEELINSRRTSEEDIHRFLETHPEFLLARDYTRFYSKVLLERETQGPLIPDFLLQPFDTELCDLLELKLPNEPVVVGHKNRKRFSGAVHTAAAQLRTYGDYFEDKRSREEIQRRYGIKAYRPRMTVVIGRTSDIDPIEYRRIATAQSDLKVMTYDDLLTRARRFLIV
jgi:anti-sigma B factor antagonist